MKPARMQISPLDAFGAGLAALAAAAVLVAMAGAAHALAYTAPTRADYVTGTGPVSAASADLNNDGMPDLITADYSQDAISIFINGGGGIFLSKVDIPVESGVDSVVPADLNDDGFMDLVVACRGSNNVAILFGDGTGAFPTKVDYAMGTGPDRATLGDVNGDGILDLVSANYTASTVSVRLGTGNGVFGPRTDYATGFTPTGLVVRDVNGDNCADVITANFNNSSVSVLLADGAGGLLPKADIALGAQPLDVTVGYFNGDNVLDMAIAVWGANRVAVLYGDGAGGFGSRINLITGTQPYSVRASDVNMDGFTDIVASNSASSTMSLFLGSGTGTFATKVDYAVGTGPGFALAIDVSGDGEPDLLCCNQGSNTFTLRKGVLPGGFSVGDTLVDMTGTDENGNPRTISAGNGKWRVIEMCAVWCPSCNAMGAEARQVCDTWANVHPLPFEYLTVLTEGADGGSASTVSDAVNWRTKYQQNSPVLNANGNRQSAVHSWATGVHSFAYPTILIVDPNGILKERYIGRLDGQTLVDHVASYAAVTPSPTLAPPLPPLPPPPPTTPTAPWRPLASANIELTYGASVWSAPLGVPAVDDGDARAFRITPTGVPGIPDTSYIEVDATTDSTTGLESYLVFVGTYNDFKTMQTAQPWQVRLTNMTWDDAQSRVLAPGSNAATVYTVSPGPVAGFDRFAQAPINPDVAYASGALAFASMPLSGIPNLPASTNAFTLSNVQTKHQFAIVGVEPRGGSGLRLAAPVPNPCSSVSSLQWAMARAGHARLQVTDVRGRYVRTLHDGAATAGDHATAWDLRDAHGAHVAPGLYFVALDADGQPRRTTRLVVVR